MAFFGIGKKSSGKTKVENGKSTTKLVAVKKKPTSTLNFPLSGSVLIRPRITEKTGNLTAANVYTFDVAMDATKRSVAAAIEAEHKVQPVKVRIVTRRAVRVRLRTRRGWGTTRRSKKAYVTVQKGDRIEFSS